MRAACGLLGLLAPLVALIFLLLPALAAPITVAEQGTICTGLMPASVDDVWPLIEDMCWNVTGGMHKPLPAAKPELHAWSHEGQAAQQHVTLIALDAAAQWETCYGSFRTIFDDCARDGKASFGMRRYGNELYIIDREVPRIPELTG